MNIEQWQFLSQTFGPLAIILPALWGIYKFLIPSLLESQAQLVEALKKELEVTREAHKREMERQRGAITNQVEERREINERFIIALETQIKTAQDADLALVKVVEKLHQTNSQEHEKILNVLQLMERRFDNV